MELLRQKNKVLLEENRQLQQRVESLERSVTTASFHQLFSKSDIVTQTDCDLRLRQWRQLSPVSSQDDHPISFRNYSSHNFIYFILIAELAIIHSFLQCRQSL